MVRLHADAITRGSSSTWPSPVHIAIEGCVGVGKTTVAKMLARYRNAGLVLEAFQKHPFLSEFYLKPTENAFVTEMHFLLLHYHQLRTIPARQELEVVTDFTFLKDKVFGALTLNNRAELAIFRKLYGFLVKRVPQPDLVIYLRATDDLILQRIRKRNRSIEQPAKQIYFKQLRRCLDRTFMSQRRNVMIIDANQFDGMRNLKLVTAINRRIDAMRKPRSC